MFMSVIMKGLGATKMFFSGLGPSGYVITALCTLLVTLSVATWFMSRNIDKLHEQVGQYKYTVTQMLQTNLQNNKSIAILEEQLNRCAKLRLAANDRANEAIESLSEAQRKAYLLSDQRADEANEITTSTTCSAPIPPRTVELLIAAADSANRGEDSP